MLHEMKRLKQMPLLFALKIGAKDKMTKNTSDIMLDFDHDAASNILSSIDEEVNKIVES